MAQEDTFDVVIIGAGHNGTSTAAYLAKSGLSVCVL
jgi:phytoene dehydrogenase-like protein